MHSRLVLVVSVVLAAFGADAPAHENGISGASGKSGSFCNRCHSGGATPTAQLDGPATLAAGASGTYTLTITGGAGVAGGLDAALDDASLAAGARLQTVSASTKILSGEVTHTAPVSFAAGQLSFQLAVVAPASARTMTLYAAGNSTNRDSTDNGDQAAATTMAIVVAGPPMPPPDFAGAPAGADLSAVTNPPDQASDLAIAPTPSGRDLTTPAGGPGSAGPPAGGMSSGVAQGGCSVGQATRDADNAGALALVWLLCSLTIVARVRRPIRRECARRARPAPSASSTSPARR